MHDHKADQFLGGLENRACANTALAASTLIPSKPSKSNNEKNQPDSCYTFLIHLNSHKRTLTLRDRPNIWHKSAKARVDRRALSPTIYQLHKLENDAVQYTCRFAQQGFILLAAPNCDTSDIMYFIIHSLCRISKRMYHDQAWRKIGGTKSNPHVHVRADTCRRHPPPIAITPFAPCHPCRRHLPPIAVTPFVPCPPLRATSFARHT